MAMMAYAVLGRGMLTADVPALDAMSDGDIRKRLPRFHEGNVDANLSLRSVLEGIARRKNITLAQLAIAWPAAQGEQAGTVIVPIPGAKSRKHLQENVAAADVRLNDDELAEIDRVAPAGAAMGTRYPTGQMHRLNI